MNAKFSLYPAFAVLLGGIILASIVGSRDGLAGAFAGSFIMFGTLILTVIVGLGSYASTKETSKPDRKQE